MKSKVCNICKIEKEPIEFTIKKDGSLLWACKKCSSEYSNKRHKERMQDPEYVERRRKRSLFYSYKTRYGTDIQVKIDKINKQENKCEICNEKLNDFSQSYLDHNHITGQVRAVLCPSCNTKLAAIEDIKFMEKAIKYLKKYELQNL